VTRTLVAAVGNIWLGDDGLGSEVVRRFAVRAARRGLAAQVDLRDFGLRAFDLRLALERCERAIVVDVVRRGAPTGTIHVLDPFSSGAAPDASAHHGLTATEVIQWAAARASRGEAPRAMRVVGCEPESFGDDDEGRIGLSAPVEGAIAAILGVLEALVVNPDWAARAEEAGGACTSSA
jgi:hydrogenase maturation protease